MRRRVHPPQRSASRVNIDVRCVRASTRLVTLEDPSADATTAADAFVRLRPPEGTTSEQVALWRDVVARVAIAVRVIAPPRAALVPAASDRSDDSATGSIRDEAMKLAAETNDADVVAMTSRVLDEVGA